MDYGSKNNSSISYMSCKVILLGDLCNVYQLWQCDELQQQLLGFVRDLLNWLLKYLKAGNVNNQYGN